MVSKQPKDVCWKWALRIEIPALLLMLILLALSGCCGRRTGPAVTLLKCYSCTVNIYSDDSGTNQGKTVPVKVDAKAEGLPGL